MEEEKRKRGKRKRGEEEKRRKGKRGKRKKEEKECIWPGTEGRYEKNAGRTPDRELDLASVHPIACTVAVVRRIEESRRLV